MYRTLPSATSVGQSADGIFDGGLRVDPVLVVEIDVVGAEPLQRALDRGADVRRAAVDDARAAAGVRDEAELRRQHDLFAAVLDGPADQLLVGVGTVDLGGVDVRDAEVERAVDGADGFGVAARADVVVAGHRHRAESDAGDVESADRNVLHGDSSVQSPDITPRRGAIVDRSFQCFARSCQSGIRCAILKSIRATQAVATHSRDDPSGPGPIQNRGVTSSYDRGTREIRQILDSWSNESPHCVGWSARVDCSPDGVRR